jgi:long-chain acyl-CoA synthetase
MKRTILSMLDDAVASYPDRPYLCNKYDDGWKPVSFKEAREQARAFAVSLRRLGFERGDAVAILSEGRAEWVVGELGVLSAGCVSVPLSIKLLPEEIPYRINHSEAKGVLVSRNILPKLDQVLDKIEKEIEIIYLDEGGPVLKTTVDPKRVHTFGILIREGGAASPEEAADLEEVQAEIGEDDVVTISYTSGTTGNPKGIMLTHLNYWANGHSSVEAFKIPYNYRTLVILPLDHSFAHTVAIFAGLLKAMTLYFVDARGGSSAILRNIAPNLVETDPDFLLTVPALTGNFMKKIRAGIAEKGGFVATLFTSGIRAGVAYHGNVENRPTLGTRVKNFLPYHIADLVVFGQVRKIFGKRLKFCIGGGALLDIKQQEFFKTLGVPVYQGYGLTEATPVISTNTPGNHKMGSSGKVIPGVECRIVGEDGTELPAGEIGEMVIRGENVMKGYLKNPEATAETVRDGSLYTGDLAYYDEDDYLIVVGRKKALLIAEDGEKYSPEEIEEAIVNCSDCISQVMLYNDHKKFTAALIVPEIDQTKQRMKAGSVRTAADVIQLLQDEMNRFKNEPVYQGRFPKVWTPVTYMMLSEPFTEENLMINSTMKMVRYKITETYQELLDYIYTDEGHRHDNPRNLDAVRELFGLEE